jgi:ribosomal protein L22
MSEDPPAVPPEETPAEKPARARRRRADAAEAPAAAEAEKPRRARAAKQDVEEAAAAAEEEAAPKPRRRRAAAKPAQEAAAEEAPKPRRTRAAKPPVEEAVEEQPAAVPAAPAPAPRRRAVPRVRARRTPEPLGEAPVVYATARYVRSSARKARLVCDHIRGKSVPEARAILAFAPRGVAKDWSKLLESAVANAEHNHELIGEELRVKTVFADVGPTLKRFRPRAQGRATPINKRTSHLSIALTPKE